MRTLRIMWLARMLSVFAGMSLIWLQMAPAFGAMKQEERIAEASKPKPVLPTILTQKHTSNTRTAGLLTGQAARPHPVADVRLLTASEMAHAHGRGPYRNPYFAGAAMPWQRSFHDVNICSGNLFKSFTDVQVAPARGAGLVLQRTYNSNDSRIGPFGVGWTHAYDIRIQEAADVAAQSGNSNADTAINDVPRTDFFGTKHTYHRDADGLYSPPPYLYDEMSSDYDTSLVNGPAKVEDDTEKGMDGTVKHYVNIVTLADGTEGNERACDSIEDRHGNRTTLTYGQTIPQLDGSTRKLLTQVTDPSGRSLAFTWTNLATAAQPAWRITQVQGPLDQGQVVPGVTYVVQYNYYTDPSEPNAANDLYNLQSVTLDPGDSPHLNRTTSYTYVGVAGAKGPENGLLASVTDPLGHVVSYSYAVQCNDAPIAGQNAITYDTRTATAWVSQITEPAGVDAGNTPRTLTWTFLSGSAYDHNAPNNPTNYYTAAVDHYDGEFIVGSTGMIIHVGTDHYNRFVSWDNYSGDICLYIVEYDADNNVTHSYRYDQNTCPFNNHFESYSYGQHGNVLMHAVGPCSATTSDGVLHPWNNGVDTTGYYNLDRYFQKSGMTDNNGRTTAMDYFTSQDASPGNRGEVKWVEDAGYADPASPSYGRQFTYTYNQYGQKANETNLNGVVTRYTYGDQWGNLTQVVQDPGGTGHLNRTTTMAYDAAGHVLQSTDPNNQTTTFGYNVLGQPLSVATLATANTPAETVSYGYDANGRTRSVTDGRGQTVMTYEASCDRVGSVTDPVTGTVSYTYTPTGERLSLTLASGRQWQYHYLDPRANTNTAARHFLMPKGNDLNSATLALDNVTDDQGRKVSYTRGNSPVPTLDTCGVPSAVQFAQVFTQGGVLASACTQTSAYDVSGPGPNSPYPPGTNPNSGAFGLHNWVMRLATFYASSAQAQSTLLSASDYTYDNVGNRQTNTRSRQLTNPDGTGQVDGSGSPVLTTRTERYGYDALYRLSSVDYGDGQTQGYGFDAMGNRAQKTDSAAGTTGYTFDAANRMTGVNGTGNYVNDMNGNTLSGGGRTNVWDSQNRLVSCTVNGITSTYTYGADGLRRSATVNGKTTGYVYDGQTLVQEMQTNAQGQLQATATYLQGPRGVECRIDETQQTEGYYSGGQVAGRGKTAWYVYDGLGSVVGEVDQNGTQTCSSLYDVYGAKRQGGTGAATSRQGFVGSLGHVTDSETGLVYMQARYYDPSTGRFVSEDSSKHGGNWFIYCNDNPANLVDKTGKIPIGPDGQYEYPEVDGWEIFNEFAEFCEKFGPHGPLLLIAKGLDKLTANVENWLQGSSGPADEIDKDIIEYEEETAQNLENVGSMGAEGAEATETSDETEEL